MNTKFDIGEIVGAPSGSQFFYPYKIKAIDISSNGDIFYTGSSQHYSGHRLSEESMAPLNAINWMLINGEIVGVASNTKNLSRADVVKRMKKVLSGEDL